MADKDPKADKSAQPQEEKGQEKEKDQDSVAQKAEFPDLSDKEQNVTAPVQLGALMDVNLKVSVILGQTTLSLAKLLKLGVGSVVELETSAGDPVDIYVNDRPYAKGEIIVIDDVFGIRLTELANNRKKDAA